LLKRSQAETNDRAGRYQGFAFYRQLIYSNRPTSANLKEFHMDLQLKGKTALVTGGSEGIGKGIAMVLAKEGVDVAICARRMEPLQKTADEISYATGRKVIPIVADLTKDADARNFVEHAHKALGSIDLMINNAGSAPGGVIETLTEDDWTLALQLKFMGYVRCLRYALPIMVKQGGGRVVNLIGNDGVKPSYWEIAPGAANAAGQNLTVSLAGQYGRHNISFCAVNPGPVRTERWSGLVNAMSRDMKISYEEADKLAPASIPLGRIAEVEEVANLVAMLASPLVQMANGTMIEIDGGQDKALMDRFRDR
jgi:NAD(P)-dependent dehydrogenase (short-subunit alcohol dehydrogenase family)